MKLTNILFSAPFIATGAKARKSHVVPGEIGINATDEEASRGHTGGNKLAPRRQGVWWDDFDDD